MPVMELARRVKTSPSYISENEKGENAEPLIYWLLSVYFRTGIDYLTDLAVC